MSNPLAKIGVEEILSGTMRAKNARDLPSEAELEIWQMSHSGYSVAEIASDKGITDKLVKERIRKVDKWINAGVMVDAVAFKAKHSLTLEALKDMAIKSFRQSSGEVEQTKEKIDADGKVVERIVTRRAQPGDPRFLNVAMKALEGQRDLWPGVAAPKAVAQTNADGTDKITSREELSQKSVDDLEKLVQMADIIDAKVVENRAQSGPDEPVGPDGHDSHPDQDEE